MAYLSPFGPLEAENRRVRRQRASVSHRWNHGARFEALANLAHELRTPAQVLLGYLEILRDDLSGEIGPRPREIIERLNVSAHDLAQTVENVLDFAADAANAEPAFDEEVDLGDLMAEIMPALEAANYRKHLTIEVSRDDAPPRIWIRRRALGATVRNLATNAIKFTEQGSVTISFRALPDSSNPELLELTVRDTGPGIDRSRLDAAFSQWSQLSRNSVRHHRGAGLGLSVVSRNLKALGATLSVRTVVGEGSAFVVRIPVRQRLGVNQRLVPAPRSPNGLRTGVRISGSGASVRPRLPGLRARRGQP